MFCIYPICFLALNIAQERLLLLGTSTAFDFGPSQLILSKIVRRHLISTMIDCNDDDIVGHFSCGSETNWTTCGSTSPNVTDNSPLPHFPSISHYPFLSLDKSRWCHIHKTEAAKLYMSSNSKMEIIPSRWKMCK